MKGDANLPVENSPVFTEAMNGIGKQFVNAKYDEFLRKKSINEVYVPLATDVAINLIEATSKTAKLVPIPTGVGGPIDAFFIGSSGAARRLR
jgi:hypothetical protein